MVSITDRSSRIIESGHKVLKPFDVDPELCLYSPQDNVDALSHPRVIEWINFILNTYEPPASTASQRVLLFLPCTATKPYVASTEHRAINARLLAEGFEPVQPTVQVPDEIRARYPDDDCRLFDLAPLRRGPLELHRVVMSEPLAFVPYEHMLDYPGGQSPAVAYDDPGLFENRGNAVSPWRNDSTAEMTTETRWRWGSNERQAYVEMHNEMARILAAVLGRLSTVFDHTISWVAPGLTHRSFCLAKNDRSAHGVAASKQVNGKRRPLVGINDLLGEHSQIEVLPSTEACDDARRRLQLRLGTSAAAANAVYARGGGGATPLALPELLDVLIERVDALDATGTGTKSLAAAS